MLFLAFTLGFSSSYLGTIAPSMLNITATKISIEKNKKTAINFCIGVALIVLIQCYLALIFLNKIQANLYILESIQSVSIVIFTLLSLVFLRMAMREKQEKTPKKTKTSGFLTGIGLSLVNMFSIPFYCGVGAAFSMSGWLTLEFNSIIFFVAGSSMGTFTILYHYVLLAEKIKPRLTKITTYLNYFLAGVTGIAALVSFLKLL